MPLWRRRAAGEVSLDEFAEGGEERAATPLDLRPGQGNWQAALAKLGKGAPPKTAAELALPAFSLVRGGDLFEAPTRKRLPTPAELLETYAGSHLRVERTRVTVRARRKVAAAGERGNTCPPVWHGHACHPRAHEGQTENRNRASSRPGVSRGKRRYDSGLL